MQINDVYNASTATRHSIVTLHSHWIYTWLLSQELCVPVTDDQAADAMRYMDRDGSGTISFEEFLAWFDGAPAR